MVVFEVGNVVKCSDDERRGIEVEFGICRK